MMIKTFENYNKWYKYHVIGTSFIIDHNIFNCVWFECREYVKSYCEAGIDHIRGAIRINHYKDFDSMFSSSDFDFDDDI